MRRPRSCRIAADNSGINSLLLALCACAFVSNSMCVDQDRIGAVASQVEQKQIQLDKYRTLQAKSTELERQESQGVFGVRLVLSMLCRLAEYVHK